MRVFKPRHAACFLLLPFLCAPASAERSTPTPNKHSAIDSLPTALRGMAGAVPQHQISALPSTSAQYQQLNQQTETARPAVVAAKHQSQRLDYEAQTLRQRLIETAAKIQQLEKTGLALKAQIASLNMQDKKLSAGFASDRVAVSRLLAVLERLQHDMPPAIVVSPDDALGAVHSSMLMGASLPRVYGVAAALSRRIDAIRRTHANLMAQRIAAVQNATLLSAARIQLARLVTLKQQEADRAAARYDDLQERLDSIAQQASDLKTLLSRVAAIRQGSAQKSLQMANAGLPMRHPLPRGELLRPVVGELEHGGLDGVGGSSAPGVTFVTSPAAQVVAPADGQVLFAGPYHKTGKVLILEMTAGYDLVMAGLDRIAVQPGNQLLAGEPLGAMPQNGGEARLYLEMRDHGKGVNPLPWLAADIRKAKKS